MSGDYDIRRDKVTDLEDAKTREEKVDGIVCKLNISDLEKFILKLALLRFLSARDCTDLVVKEAFTSVGFIIIRENEHVRTCNEFILDPDLSNGLHLFSDCYTTHHHDGLFSNPEFRQLVDNTPYEFLDIVGGYEIRHDDVHDLFELVDEINVKVSFKVDSKTERLYELDTDTMAFTDYWDISI
nr:hypothetical protein [uncultured Methanobrevibacter sp.]